MSPAQQWRSVGVGAQAMRRRTGRQVAVLGEETGGGERPARMGNVTVPH